MSEHQSTADAGPINEKVDQARDKVSEITSKVAPDRELQVSFRTNVFEIVTAVAVVGILINNRRSLKYTKKIVKNMDKNVAATQQTIKALKEAGQTFEFFPGIGIWVE